MAISNKIGDLAYTRKQSFLDCVCTVASLLPVLLDARPTGTSKTGLVLCFSFK